MSSPEQALFQAVIIRAIMDARGALAGLEHKQAGHLERDRARTWLCDGGPDFQRVCALAGFEPSSITSAFKAGKFDGVHFETATAGQLGKKVVKRRGLNR